MTSNPTLLAVVELGGYPDFSRLYAEAGFTVTTVTSVRKALASLKLQTFTQVVAEFNFQSDFRDRTSSVETLLAVLQKTPQTQVLVLYESEYQSALARLLARFPVTQTLALPVVAQQLLSVIRNGISTSH